VLGLFQRVQPIEHRFLGGRLHRQIDRRVDAQSTSQHLRRRQQGHQLLADGFFEIQSALFTARARLRLARGGRSSGGCRGGPRSGNRCQRQRWQTG
jgi:hypothetical protein